MADDGDRDGGGSMPPDPLGPAFPSLDWKPVVTWLRDLQIAGATLDEAAALISAYMTAMYHKGGGSDGKT
jgi:hypothetical protein